MTVEECQGKKGYESESSPDEEEAKAVKVEKTAFLKFYIGSKP